MKQIIKVDNLVLGGSLEALEYSFKEGYPIFYKQLELPFFLEQTKEGLSRKDILENYAFLLSLAGLNYSSSVVGESRLEGNKLILTGKKPWITEIIFTNIFNFENSFEEEKYYKVIDYIDIRSCGNHDVRELKTEDNFCKEIYFYPSKRVNVSKNFKISSCNYEKIPKDCIVISYLMGKEIEKEDNSSVYTRLRLKEIMKDVGIKGKKCGIDAKGRQKYNSIKLEFSKREIIQVEEEERNYYYSQSKNSYLNKLYNHLYGRNT